MLGKLVARLLHLFAHIAVGLPVLALIRLLGGVSAEQVAALFVVTASTLLATAGLSMAISVHARRAREAVTAVFSIGAIIFLLPWLTDAILRWTWPNVLQMLDPVLEPLAAANPVTYLARQVMAGRDADWPSIWELVRNQAVLAVGGTAVAVWRVRAVYVKQTYGTVARRRERTWRLWNMPLGDSPMIWKELVTEGPSGGRRVRGMVGQGLLALAVVVPSIWIFLRVGDRSAAWDREAFRIFVTFLGTTLACLGVLIVAVRGAASITSERERQTWDVLLATPLEAREILVGKLLGGLYAARWVMSLVVLLWVLGILRRSVSLLMTPIVFGEILLMSAFAALLGFVFSLKLKTSLRAMAATVSVLLFVGGGYLFCCVPMIGSRGSEVMVAGCIPFLIGLPMIVDPIRERMLSDPEGGIVMAFVFGTMGYTVAALCLFSNALHKFDEFAGRVVGPWRAWRGMDQDNEKGVATTAGGANRHDAF